MSKNKSNQTLDESLSKGDIFTAEITDMNNFGNGICRILSDSRVIFIKGAVSGDIVTAEISEVHREYLIAEIVSVNRRSESRITPICPIFGKCGGCDFLHIDYSYELELKRKFIETSFRKNGFFKNDGLKIPPIISNGIRESYRNKIMVRCFYNGERLLYGYYESSTNSLIPFKIDGKRRPCILHPIIFDKILESSAEYLNKANPTEINGFYLRKGAASDEIMLCVICSVKSGGIIKNNLGEDISLLFAEYISRLYPEIKSVLVGISKDKPGDETDITSFRLIYGKEKIKDTLCGIEYNISPQSFYQINHDAAEILYRKIAEFARIDKNSPCRILDLYCGMGTISLYLAKNYPNAKILGMEIIPQAIKNAKSAAIRNNIYNTEFICGDAVNIDFKKADIVIVDPPRKGCSRALLEKISDILPSRLIYVSCSPQTLARDAAILRDFGFYIDNICGVDMFPCTGHVETVVLLSQQKPDDTIEIDLDLDELDATAAETKATYEEIKAYVWDKHHLKVSSLYISQIKRKCGLEVGQNYNLSKSENPKVPKCPPEKEAAIMDALKHFQMI